MKFAGTKAMTQKWMAEICNLLSSKKYFIKATKSRENFSVIHFSFFCHCSLEKVSAIGLAACATALPW
jgi:hypothetical protein